MPQHLRKKPPFVLDLRTRLRLLNGMCLASTHLINCIVRGCDPAHPTLTCSEVVRKTKFDLDFAVAKERDSQQVPNAEGLWEGDFASWFDVRNGEATLDDMSVFEFVAPLNERQLGDVVNVLYRCGDTTCDCHVHLNSHPTLASDWEEASPLRYCVVRETTYWRILKQIRPGGEAEVEGQGLCAMHLMLALAAQCVPGIHDFKHLSLLPVLRAETTNGIKFNAVTHAVDIGSDTVRLLPLFRAPAGMSEDAVRCLALQGGEQLDAAARWTVDDEIDIGDGIDHELYDAIYLHMLVRMTRTFIERGFRVEVREDGALQWTDATSHFSRAIRLAAKSPSVKYTRHRRDVSALVSRVIDAEQ